MKILGKNILVKILDKKEIFADDYSKALGKVVGIGEDVSIDIKIGDQIYFHPSGVTKINEEEWDVVQESSVICKRGETK